MFVASMCVQAPPPTWLQEPEEEPEPLPTPEPEEPKKKKPKKPEKQPEAIEEDMVVPEEVEKAELVNGD